MTVLAGFDLVIELNSKVIEETIASTSFGGTTLSPPTEIVLGDKTNGVDAVLLDPVSFALQVGTNGISISIPFDETTIFFQGKAVGPLKGSLGVTGTIDQFLKDSVNMLFDIGLIVPPNGISIQWDTTTNAYTAASLSTLSSSDRATMEGSVKTAIWSVLANNIPAAGISFNEDNSRDGLLGKTGFRFRSVTVQNIDSKTIGLFCVMLLTSETPGSVVRSEPGLPGTSQAALSMSGATFQQLIFCPGVTESLVQKFDPNTQTPDQFAAVVHSKMPPACGTVDYVPLSGGLKLTNILTTLENGYVEIDGTAIQGKTDVYCFRLVANFSTHLTFSVKNGAIQAQIVPNPPKIDAYVDVSWFCAILYFLAALVASPITALLAFWILLTVEWIAFTFVPVFAPALNVGLGQTEQVGLSGFKLKAVDVFEDRLTLIGNVEVAPTQHTGQGRSVTLAITDTQTNDQAQIGKGTYDYPGSKFCPPKQYPYTQYTDEQQITVKATPYFMGAGPTFKWKVEGVLLAGPSGHLSLNVGAWIPQPGGLTLSLGLQPVTVSYNFVDETTLQLTGHGALIYSINVAVECDSETDFEATDNLFATFTNYTIDMEGGFAQDMERCRMASRLSIGLMRTIPQAVPRGGDGPDYEQTVKILREAAVQGRAGVQDEIIEGIRVYGNKLVDDMLKGAGEEEQG